MTSNGDPTAIETAAGEENEIMIEIEAMTRDNKAGTLLLVLLFLVMGQVCGFLTFLGILHHGVRERRKGLGGERRGIVNGMHLLLGLREEEVQMARMEQLDSMSENGKRNKLDWIAIGTPDRRMVVLQETKKTTLLHNMRISVP